MPLAQPKEKFERRIGERLFLKGERSFSQKAAIARRPYPPGQLGKKKTRKGGQSEYGRQLREKQKVCRIYGIKDGILKKYFIFALKDRMKPTDVTLGDMLERRLDNVVFRLGFALSRSIARHMVSYGHIAINGKRVKQPSYRVKIGDAVSILETSRKSGIFNDLTDRLQKHTPQEWLELNRDRFEGKIVGLPRLEDIAGQQNMTLVVEYYSK